MWFLSDQVSWIRMSFTKLLSDDLVTALKMKTIGIYHIVQNYGGNKNGPVDRIQDNLTERTEGKSMVYTVFKISILLVIPIS